MSSASAVPGTEFVMSKFFGLTYEQALRVQALLRLGISEEDVRVAERLMAPRSTTERVSTAMLRNTNNIEYAEYPAKSVALLLIRHLLAQSII